ncbi:MAG TPA: GNAT family N-acetyltransferase [Syntrophales bacterium]|nr:GNAT family N-acetyltransferase [Syntrophales bacterium]
MIEDSLSYREEVLLTDGDDIRAIVSSSGFFSCEEIGIAVELLEERLARGEASGYFFLFAEQEGRVVGYTCFGPIAGSRQSYDLYWIAVHDRLRRRGLGKDLLAKSEVIILRKGGKRIYIETSSRPQYETTLAFYMDCGYWKAALLEDFYAPGDGKIILLKVM